MAKRGVKIRLTEKWFGYFLKFMLVVFIILLIITLIKEGFPLP